MNHGSLFSGLGGFDLAAQWAGWNNMFHCELNPFCRKILNYYWPKAHSVSDIMDLTVDNYGNLLYFCEKNIITMGQPRSTKYDNVVKVYEDGMSIQECANFYEISRQAMHKILKRRGCNFRNSLKYGKDNNFHRGSLEEKGKKKRVQHLVEKAVKKGILINPNKCESCEKENTFKDGRSGIQAHHSDYDKPLDVNWFCQKCHYKWHKKNKAINETDEEKTNEPSGAIDVLSGGFP